MAADPPDHLLVQELFDLRRAELSDHASRTFTYRTDPGFPDAVRQKLDSAAVSRSSGSIRMKSTTRRQRTAKKLLLPLIAIGTMTIMMAWDSTHRPHPTGASRAPAAARMAPDVRQR